MLGEICIRQEVKNLLTDNIAGENVNENLVDKHEGEYNSNNRKEDVISDGKVVMIKFLKVQRTGNQKIMSKIVYDKASEGSEKKIVKM